MFGDLLTLQIRFHLNDDLLSVIHTIHRQPDDLLQELASAPSLTNRWDHVQMTVSKKPHDCSDNRVVTYQSVGLEKVKGCEYFSTRVMKGV